MFIYIVVHNFTFIQYHNSKQACCNNVIQVKKLANANVKLN